MKKLLLVLGASVLVLSACHKATEENTTSPSTPREQQTKEVTNYFHYLADSYQEALSHEKEVKDATVQSPMAATLVAMEELQLSLNVFENLFIISSLFYFDTHLKIPF